MKLRGLIRLFRIYLVIVTKCAPIMMKRPVDGGNERTSLTLCSNILCFTNCAFWTSMGSFEPRQRTFRDQVQSLKFAGCDDVSFARHPKKSRSSLEVSTLESFYRRFSLRITYQVYWRIDEAISISTSRVRIGAPAQFERN